MITLSQQEIQHIEDQFATAMFKAFEKVQGSITQASLATPHWVSHSDAIEKMGWPEILLRKGVKNGHLNPITFQGKGGTQYDVKELSTYKEWLMAERRSNRLDPDYLTNTLAQSTPDNYVFPDHSQKGRPENRLPGRRKSVSR